MSDVTVWLLVILAFGVGAFVYGQYLVKQGKALEHSKKQHKWARAVTSLCAAPIPAPIR
jgi:hypothetical protein